MSEDIELHRKIMGTGLLPEDEKRTDHARDIYLSLLASLGCRNRSSSIDFDKIEKATRQLSETYDASCWKEAGGLMVPLTRDLPDN